MKRRKAHGKIYAQDETAKLGGKTICRFNDTQAKEKSPCADSKILPHYDCGNCIALDDGEPCICVQSISYSLCCTWFRDWVLPGAPALQAEITSPKGLKRCTERGAPFLAKSNLAKYCPDCARKVHRRQKTASDRKRRSNTDK